MQSPRTLESVPDDELLRRLVELLRQSRHTEADLVGEVDARRLYAHEATPSMSAYCTERLHLSEAEAYLRIAAARASREHPILLDMLADGRLHITAVAKLAAHLTAENREVLLARAAHRTKRQVEELVAELLPRPDALAVMREVPERRMPARTAPALRLDAPPALATSVELRPDAVDSTRPPGPSRRPRANCVQTQLRPPGRRSVTGRVEPPATVQPLAPARYKVQFTASAELRGKLERLQGLMRRCPTATWP